MNSLNISKAVDLRRELHKNPEVSNEETWTKARLMAFLKAHTQLEIVDRGAWFYAVYRSERSNGKLAFRADIDAIRMDETLKIPHASTNPGVSHKCGHDGHAAALACFALEVDEKGCDNDVFFIFQHAEETGDGAKVCASLMKERKIDAIFAFHNMSGMEKNAVYVIDGTSHFASKGMSLYMKGKPSHASQPELGINPAFAIAEIIGNIPAWCQPEKNRGLVLCTVIQIDVGEKAFGVSASTGVLRLTIRAQYENEMDRLEDAIAKYAHDLCRDQGIALDITCTDAFPETSNHKDSSDKIRAVCKAQGIRLVEMQEGFRASEDFGHYLKETSGAIFYIGNGMDYPPIHTHLYDFPDDCIERAVEVFKGLAGMMA